MSLIYILTDFPRLPTITKIADDLETKQQHLVRLINIDKLLDKTLDVAHLMIVDLDTIAIIRDVESFTDAINLKASRVLILSEKDHIRLKYYEEKDFEIFSNLELLLNNLGL